MTKQVLIVGMLDSVHLARWTSQFLDTDTAITLFPSRRFRKVHPMLRQQIENGLVSIANELPKKSLVFLGYIDFLLYELKFSSLFGFSRGNKLISVLSKKSYDFVHLIEFQHAGYMYAGLEFDKKPKWKTILTNLGSDIYYFSQFPEHREKITQLLQTVDAYSAECNRDYKLARDFGFVGAELPLVPNAGGFPNEIFEIIKVPMLERNEIFLKGYGGEFGLPDIMFAVSEKILLEYSTFMINIVSVTPDLLPRVKSLQKKYPKRVKYWTTRRPIPHELVLELLGRSIIYFGFSKSDGISTTFLESLIMGCYPIQTSTSCANEWISKGFIASSVEANISDLFPIVDSVLRHKVDLDKVSSNNLQLAQELLKFDQIRKTSIHYYE
jgi:hypothetical protein